MRKWIDEDWEFTIEVVKGKAEECRLGLEQGDVFRCEYGCPEGFCMKTAPVLYAYCEVVRCGGDLRLRGGKEQGEIEFPCADGPVTFRLRARRKG
ncbi:MAG: TIGR04076 family protein [Eubacteriales bacterium]|nr:TIGR04076 family protein [Eubacteriales bacterium]